MKTILVEDNVTLAEDLLAKLKRSFGEPIWCRTESDFVAALDDIRTDPPAVFVIDVMLQWDIPRREGIRPQPPEANNMYKAGIRCVERLNHPRTEGIPVILYTLVDRPDLENDIARLPENVKYLQKAAELDPLVDLIRILTTDSRPVGVGRG